MKGGLRTLQFLCVGFLVLVTVGVISFIYCNYVAVKGAKSIQCLSHIKAISMGCRLWTYDHWKTVPTNFTCMSNELVTPKILHCSADSARPPVDTWQKFTEASSSYEIISPGVPEGTTNVVFIRCRIHGHLGFTDGSVMNADRTRVLR
jgi:hypothetical protein